VANNGKRSERELSVLAGFRDADEIIKRSIERVLAKDTNQSPKKVRKKKSPKKISEAA
jgi:hypothetical protein